MTLNKYIDHTGDSVTKATIFEHATYLLRHPHVHPGDDLQVYPASILYFCFSINQNSAGI